MTAAWAAGAARSTHLDGGTGAAQRTGPDRWRSRAPARHAAGLAARRGARDDRCARRGLAGSTARAAGRRAAHSATLALSDLAWARPVRTASPAPAPRRIADVLQRRRGDGRAASPRRRPPRRRRRARAPAPPPPPRAGTAPDSAGAGRAGLARPDHRPGAGDGRRLELRGQPVQPGDAGAAPAGLQLQAVRLSDRAGKGHLAQPALPGRADRDGHGARDGGGRTTTRWTSAARRRCASRWRSR